MATKRQMELERAKLRLRKRVLIEQQKETVAKNQKKLRDLRQELREMK